MVLLGLGRVAVQGARIHVGGAQRLDLVHHETEQRRYDDGDALVDDCRELETQTLAERGGRLDEDIFAVQSREDDFSLERAALEIKMLSS